MKRKIIGIYSVFIGASVISMWLMILNGANLPEGKTELSFHLFSEFLMACICIVSGILLLRRRRPGKPLNFLGLGMVLYSVLNAAGYYGELDNSAMMVMFIVLFVLTAAVLSLHFFETQQDITA